MDVFSYHKEPQELSSNTSISGRFFVVKVVEDTVVVTVEYRNGTIVSNLSLDPMHTIEGPIVTVTKNSGSGRVLCYPVSQIS